MKWGIGVILGLGVLVLGQRIWVSQEGVREILAQNSMDNTDIDEMIEAQKHLATIDAFHRMGSERDAGPLLNPFIGLDGFDIGPQQTTWWNDLSADQMSVIKENWLTQPELLPSGDLSILQDLLAYDHWDRDDSGAMADYLAAPRDVSWTAVPIPNLINIQYLARLRLAKGLVDQDMLLALQEVRHLARLTHDGEILVDTMVAIALLGIERKGYEAAVEAGILTADAWVPVSEEDLVLARRVALGMVVVYRGLAPDDAVERLESAGVPLFGLCSAISESGMQMLLPRIVQGTAWPGEVDLTANWEVHGSRLDTERCSLALSQLYWEQPDLGSAEILEAMPMTTKLPYNRTSVIAVLWYPRGTDEVSSWFLRDWRKGSARSIGQ
jgi:hypothetical protein